MLDSNEYLHLALNANKANDHHAALLFLKHALEQAPDNYAALYLLAAEHAELGMHVRAAGELSALLEKNPAIDIARFQLALLYLQLNDTEAAKQHFSDLNKQERDPSLSLFSTAYLAVLDGNPAVAGSKIKEGIAICPNNALKADMLKLLQGLDGNKAESSAPAPGFLGAYRESLEES